MVTASAREHTSATAASQGNMPSARMTKGAALLIQAGATLDTIHHPELDPPVQRVALIIGT